MVLHGDGMIQLVSNRMTLSHGMKGRLKRVKRKESPIRRLLLLVCVTEYDKLRLSGRADSLG